MTDRLHKVLMLIEQLSQTTQDEVAAQLEDWVEPFSIPQPKSLAGAWADLPDADEMIDALYRLRHESAVG